MYHIKVNNKEFTIPKGNLVAFAMVQAMNRGINRGNIHNDATAIEYLTSIGYEVWEHTDNGGI